MRLSILAAAGLAGCTAASGVQQDAPPPDPQAYASQLFAGLADRIVDVEEHRSGPGHLMLTHVTLYERPESSPAAGLCQVRVHSVALPHVPPPADPPREAIAIATSTRYYAIGPVQPSPVPSGQPAQCAALPSARNFFAASADDARLALQMLTEARLFAERMPAAIRIECGATNIACGDPALIFRRYMTADTLASVRRVPCEPGRPGRGETCFLYSFRPVPNGLGGDWTLDLKGPERPMHAILTSAVPPVE